MAFSYFRGMEAARERTVLGIDPGTNVMGYGIVAESAAGLSVVALGSVDLRKMATHYLKLGYIYDRVRMLVEQYRPHEVALEAPFCGKNVQSMLKLGRAQGVAMAAALGYKIPIFEYAPTKVKQSITGNGAAGKEQVARMLLCEFGIDAAPSFFDATDGLAVAVCHCRQSGLAAAAGAELSSGGAARRGRGKSSWGDFVSQNPDRVV